MSQLSRRSLAALASTVVLAAGALTALGSGTASAASTATGAADGLIAFRATNGAVQTVNADGTGLQTIGALPALDSGALSWSAHGSRLAESGNGQVWTVRADGSDPTTVSTGQNVSAVNNVYGEDGSWLVSEHDGKIYQQTADGWNWVVPVMTAKQETGYYDSEPAMAWTGLYAFVRWGSTKQATSGVWTFNRRTGATHLIAANGDRPTFSADGETVIYQTWTSGQLQVFAVDANGAHTRQLTHDPNGASRASLSPDGTKLAYTSFDNARSRDIVKVLDLATQTTTEVGTGSSPVWQPLRKSYLDHVYGTGKVSDDAAASRWAFNSVGSSTPGLVNAYGAVLVNKNDATGVALGVALAGEKQAPLLLTSGSSLDPAASDELRRVLRRGGTVYLEGGTSELSGRLAAQVQRLGYRAARVNGSGAAALSIASARTLTSQPSWIFVADAQDYRTAASVATAAAATGRGGRTVVLLNTGWTLPSSIAAYLNGLNPNPTRTLAVGSRSVYAMEHTRKLHKLWHFWTITGSDPETVSLTLARWWWGSPMLVTLANPSDWRAGMAGASANAGYGPLLWTSAKQLDAADRLYLSQENAGIFNVQIFGSSWPTTTVLGVEGAVPAAPSWMQLAQNPNGTTPAVAHTAPHATTGGPALPPGASVNSTR